ncbi:MAG: thioredoxin-disulfide reductase [Bacteroidetes bacterium]|nr:thioredoxin-disulfide reductase [Bacteroidota bacterium]MCW5895194.1 thioredoxin-disulfide reductase [Bacteroidota bacterium]
MANHHKLIIIGSGPAGFTAALYAGRANLNPVVFEGIQPGGQLTITTEVENYPGFAKGIMGPELMDIMRTQAQRFGAESIYKLITKVDFSQRPFRLWADEEEYTADAVIVATGASAKLLGLPSEKEYMGYGVSACATCDGFFFRNQEVIVVGGGDTAIEEATFLTKFASKVTIVHRRDALRASKIMQEKALKNPKIAFAWDSVVEEILGKNENGRKLVTGVRLKNVKTGAVTDVKADGVFMGIGHQPNTSLFKGQLEMDEVGYLKLRDRSTRTNIAGVFAAGDVADSVYRQAVTAAGSGCAAAIDAERWLESQHD